ncbi:MAG: hypothetical protein PW788_02250 [Micavibrio sp.]|nr:hypothetical protein [Micavibrio sp.]
MEKDLLILDQSGSMPPPAVSAEHQAKFNKILDDFRKSTDDIIAASQMRRQKSSALPNDSLIGSPGTSKAESEKIFAELLFKNTSGKLDNIYKFSALEELEKKIEFTSEDQEKIAKTLQDIVDILPPVSNRFKFNFANIAPLDDDSIMKAVGKELDKAGVTGDERDTIEELVRERVTGRQYNQDAGLRPVIQDVKQMAADPASHPELAARMTLRTQKRAVEKMHAHSRDTGHKLATGFASGISVKVRALKPPSFKPRQK